MALLQRLQAVSRISRGLKRLNDIGDYLSGDISRGLSYEAGAVASVKAGSPVKLLQTDFRLSESLDFHLRSPTSVNVRHGSPYALYAEWTGPGEPDRFSTEIRLMESVVQELVHSQTAASITAHIPERYCSLNVNTAGGDISVPGLNEAWLGASTTSSGSISVGKCKGSSVSLATEDGNITGSLTASDINVKSRSGSIDLKRLAGLKASVAISEGGAQCQLRLGTLQCLSATVDSGGSNITIKQIGVGPGAPAPGQPELAGMGVVVKSGTGSITCFGVDGPARLESDGGDIHVQILRCVNLVAITHGGVITVQLEPAQKYMIHARAKHGVHLGEGCVPEAGTQRAAPTELHGCVACESDVGLQAKGPRMPSESPGGQQLLQFTADTIRIERKSWRDSLRDRLLSATSSQL